MDKDFAHLSQGEKSALFLKLQRYVERGRWARDMLVALGLYLVFYALHIAESLGHLYAGASALHARPMALLTSIKIAIISGCRVLKGPQMNTLFKMSYVAGWVVGTVEDTLRFKGKRDGARNWGLTRRGEPLPSLPPEVLARVAFFLEDPHPFRAASRTLTAIAPYDQGKTDKIAEVSGMEYIMGAVFKQDTFGFDSRPANESRPAPKIFSVDCVAAAKNLNFSGLRKTDLDEDDLILGPYFTREDEEIFLSRLDDVLCTAAKVERLDIAENFLQEVPRSLSALRNLSLLYVDGNPLSNDALSVISTLENLETLSVGHWHIKEIPESFSNLAKLKTLAIEGTQIARLPESLGSLVNLEALYLRYNRLTGLPKSFVHLSKLKFIYLEGNGPPGRPGIEFLADELASNACIRRCYGALFSEQALISFPVIKDI